MENKSHVWNQPGIVDFFFTSWVEETQSLEIWRINKLLAGLNPSRKESTKRITIWNCERTSNIIKPYSKAPASCYVLSYIHLYPSFCHCWWKPRNAHSVQHRFPIISLLALGDSGPEKYDKTSRYRFYSFMIYNIKYSNILLDVQHRYTTFHNIHNLSMYICIRMNYIFRTQRNTQL